MQSRLSQLITISRSPFFRIVFPRKAIGWHKLIIGRLFCSVNNPSSNIWLQLLQCGGRDTAAGLYIFADSRRYLVNTGENTLRLLKDRGLPVNSLDKIFLTGSTMNHIGGLTNTLLATQETLSRDRPIDVYGPQDLEAYIHTTRRSFQYLSKFDFVKLQFVNERTSWQEILKDRNLMVWGCAISNEPGQRSSNVIYPRYSISYAFELQPPPRRLSVDFARELHIPDDVLHGVAEQCQRGNSVTLSCGKVIHPDDVFHPPQPKQSFLVFDCPSEHVFKTLSQFDQSSCINQDLNLDVDLIIHMTPLEIARSQSYKNWMNTFDERTKHVLVSSETDSNRLLTLFGFDKLFNKLCANFPRFFPTLSSYCEDVESSKDFGCANNVVVGQPWLKYIFRPSGMAGLDENTARATLACAKRVRNNTSSETSDKTLNKQNDFEVVFLGTGSRVSSTLRNTSGILLNMTGNTSLLMDCGEGTFRQMNRHYGDKVNVMLKRLRTVFVSHMHVDHHLGLVNILIQRKKVVGKSDYVRIIGPESLDLFLRYFEMLSGESLNFRFTQFWWLKRESGNKEGRGFSKSLGLSSIAVVPTKHSDYSHGLVLKRNGWKIVYSADTRPCKQLIDAGDEATLLIHEATFEDQLLERAKVMNHCTVSEAIKTSELMKAQYTILTHVSSRHLFPCKTSRLPLGVSFALDHMVVQQKDLPSLHGIMPSLERTVYRSQKTRKRPQKQKMLMTERASAFGNS